MKKRILCGLLCSLLLMLSVAACQSDSPAGTSGETSSSSSSSSSETESANNNAAQNEKFSISITTAHFGTLPTGTLVQEEWEKICAQILGKELDIKWEYIQNADYSDKLRVILAGGDYPDILTSLYNENSLTIQHGDNGAFIDVAPYLDRLPNYKSHLDQAEQTRGKLYSPEGRLYGFYNAQVFDYQSGSLIHAACVRKDILDQHNLNVPTTVEAFYQTAKALKEVYPDKYPITLIDGYIPPQNMLYTSANMYCQWNQGFYYDDNINSFEYAYDTDAYKEVVQELNRWYSEGLISPDYFTFDYEMGQAAIANGDAMMVAAAWSGWPYYINADHPNQNWVIIPGLKNEKYGNPHMFERGPTDRVTFVENYLNMINAKTEALDDILIFLDAQYSDEIVTLVNYGVKDVTYFIDENGDKKFFDWIFDTSPDAQDKNYFGIGSGRCRGGLFPQVQVMASYDVVPEIMDFYYLDNEVFTGRVFEFALEYMDSTNIAPQSTIILKALSSDDNAEYANIITPIDTYVTEQRAAFITGRRSFDEWDTYVQEVRSMGDIARATELWNSRIDR